MLPSVTFNLVPALSLFLPCSCGRRAASLTFNFWSRRRGPVLELVRLNKGMMRLGSYMTCFGLCCFDLSPAAISAGASGKGKGDLSPRSHAPNTLAFPKLKRNTTTAVSGPQALDFHSAVTVAPLPHETMASASLSHYHHGLGIAETGYSDGENDDSFYVQPEEHVVALHDFSSNNATCLSFQAGQVIKVYNRDPSGWWDGELDGHRGWFPSNYVDQEAVYVADPDESDGQLAGYAESGYGAYSESDNGEGSSIPYPASYQRERYYSAHTSRSPTPTSTPFADNGDGGVLDPILHAISLLRNAVRANRVSHFQPSTACVISSVRSVLSATDCLTRESSVLQANPQLARERKAILSELSKLVTQARKASAPMVDETFRNVEMDTMVSLAEQVLRNVRRFIEVAVDCGVPVPERRSSVYDDLYSERNRSQHPSADRTRNPAGRQELDKTPTPDSPHVLAAGLHGPAYVDRSGSGHPPPRATKSYADMRRPYGQRRHLSDASADSEGSGDAVAQARSLTHNKLVAGRAVGAEQTAAAAASTSRQTSQSLLMARSRSDSSSESPDSTSGHETGSQHGSTGSAEDDTPPASVERTPHEVMQRLSTTNDQLLSIIAAFIGHVHTHTSESHASSYARLIDMTREAVVGVRNLLLVVEAVNNNSMLQQQRPRETSILWETRENLYEATTQLVTAARIVTSAPSAAIVAGSAAEAEDKAHLLQAATSVLRTGGECVGAVRLCIDRLDRNFAIVLPEPTRSYRSSQASSMSHRDERFQGDRARDSIRDDDDEADAMSRSGVRDGPRRKHTLSFLGRKATSLSCLKQQYERDEQLSSFEDIDEDDLSVNEDEMPTPSALRMDRQLPDTEVDSTVKAERSHGRMQSLSNDMARVTASELAPQRRRAATSSRPPGSISGSSGASSVDLSSREPSRTSRSTIQSIYSENTGETSARNSLDQQPHPGHDSGRMSQSQTLHNKQQQQHQRRQSQISTDAHSTAQAAAKQLAGGVTDRQSMYREPRGPAVSIEARYMGPDYDPSDVICNGEGQVTGASLQALVEKMTPHDTTIDPTFSNAFFVCFRMFTSPVELLETLTARFDMHPPASVPMSEADVARWREKKVTPVQLRVLNFLKNWLESHWNPATDAVILEKLINFTERAASGPLANPAQRLGELARKRLDNGAQKTTVLVGNQRGPGSLQRVISSDRMKHGSLGLAMTDASQMYAPSAFARGAPPPPTSLVSKTLLSNLRSENLDKISILDFDPLELARQLTILDSKLYCAIGPEELLGSKYSKETREAGASDDVHVKSMSSTSTRITGWISECILGEVDARKRTQLLKFFIKLGDRCEQLNNFHTLMAIQCALNSSTIARLKKTWDGLSQKYRGMMDHQRRVVEHTRNYAGYRARLRGTSPPAVPFLGLFLTDLTFCHEGNAPTRPCPSKPDKKLLNFDKYVKISRIVGEVQRFQVPYNLVEVAEMQKFLQRALDDVQGGNGGRGADDLYRRSLLLEPRAGSKSNNGSIGVAGGANGGAVSNQGAITGSNTGSLSGSVAMRSGGGDGGKMGGLDIFNWRTDRA
ncbi:ras GEF [Testicularia cyperi]|uniref:Ras GEF n=1 Tax=Testicularia cyperi TaxID=1882483 RepID=A0A317XR18_9BASI|nr:ras GEF [Testicularia cyperi]